MGLGQSSMMPEEITVQKPGKSGQSKTPSRHFIDSRFDPRSPSNNVVRTPIQMEKTSSQSQTFKSTTLINESTPEVTRKTHSSTPVVSSDPRSPSSNVERTPIVYSQDFVRDPRSPTEGIMRTPVFDQKEQESADDVFGVSVVYSDATLSGTGDIFGSTENLLLPRSPDVRPRLGVSPLVKQFVEPVNKVLDLMEGEEVSEKKVKIVGRKKGAETKKHLVGKTPPRSPLKIIQQGHVEGQRSPLSARKLDLNSPRIIVQRKQMTKISVHKNTNNYGILYDISTDKENLEQ